MLKKGAKAPVNRDSLFTIGSCTKAFTTVAISMLVQDGKLSWDGASAYRPMKQKEPA